MHILLLFFLCNRVQCPPPIATISTAVEIWADIPKVPAKSSPTYTSLREYPKETNITLLREDQHRQQEMKHQSQITERELLHQKSGQQNYKKYKQHASKKIADRKLQKWQEKPTPATKQQKQQAVQIKQAMHPKLEKERQVWLSQLQDLSNSDMAKNDAAVTSKSTGTGNDITEISAGYGDKVRHRVRPNIFWAGTTKGLDTLITVCCAPNGMILNLHIIRSSGNPQWDEAARRAVQRSNPMPLDIYGKAPRSFNIQIRPTDR
ncbi:cell envelope integrity protein TolA [Candidatus Vallotiella sp. (ex Adelges kitamiensis)]|uniref:cell envelope integrity protein TolA n=1 Tax=Candidatus Vallotiella sp. (ex Adelges kitamiensis) TaxID=2864217 RepID=UPI001CE3B1E0|nr:cell envelope integrity protein TolA [Candidatus Vallotia sp. (ex Adelges kitamiensis)]